MRRDHRRSLLKKTANSVVLTGEANGAATLSKSHAAGSVLRHPRHQRMRCDGFRLRSYPVTIALAAA
jgi:hypothetical protein